MEILLNKGVLKDPLSFYSQVEMILDTPLEKSEGDLHIVRDWVEMQLLKYDKNEDTVRKNIKSFFKQYFSLAKNLDEYGLPWDMYIVSSNSYKLHMAIVMKLEDFSLYDVGIKKEVWEMKSPYFVMNFSVNLHGEMQPYSYGDAMSVFKTEIDYIEIGNEFVHPHCDAQINRNWNEITRNGNGCWPEALTHYGRMFNNYHNLCLGNSGLLITFQSVLASQNEFNYFMFRAISYIKEYNTNDVRKFLPIVNNEKIFNPWDKIRIIPPLSYGSETMYKILLSFLKNNSLNYFFTRPDETLELNSFFWDNIKKVVINEDLESLKCDGAFSILNLKAFIMLFSTNLLAIGEDASFYSINKINTNVEAQNLDIIERNVNSLKFPLLFDGEKVYVNYYSGILSKKVNPDEFYFNNNFKTYIENGVTEAINSTNA